jgi:hypothetical protein
VEEVSGARSRDSPLAMDQEVLFAPARSWALVDPQRSLDYLERLASDPEDVTARVAWFEVLVDPAFDSVRDDPSYEALMESFGL